MTFCGLAASVAENFLGGNMGREYFQGNNVNSEKPKMSPLYMVLFITIYLVVVLVAGQYLWNEVLCKVVTICKPMPSLLHLLGLVLLIDLLMPRMCC